MTARDPASDTPPKTRWEYLLVAVIVLVGLAARSYQADFDLDRDEILSVNLVSNPFTHAVSRALANTAHPPLHVGLLYVWIKGFGRSEVSVRGLSILLSMGFLLTAYALLRRFLDTWLALGVLALLAVSPLFVFFGEQARPYSLIALLSAANLLAFVKLLEQPGNRKRVRVWAVTCALLVYAHYLGTILIGFEVAVALLYARLGLTVAYHGLAAASLIAPWLLVAMGPKLANGLDPIPDISWITVPGPVDLAWFYVSIFGELPSIRSRWLLFVLMFAGIGYAYQIYRQKKLSPEQLLLIAVGILLPVFEFALSVWGPKPIFIDRQMLVGALAFLVLIGLGLAALPRILALGALMVLLVWTAAAMPSAFPRRTRVPVRDVLTRIHTDYGSELIAAQETWISGPLAYYRQTGPVRLLSQLTDEEMKDEFLFVCRTMKCSEMDSEKLKHRRSLVAVWRWGQEEDLINLYRIGSVSE
jgi:uncharacterized membrane protein